MGEHRPSAKEVDCPAYLHSSNNEVSALDHSREEERVPALSPSAKAHVLGKNHHPTGTKQGTTADDAHIHPEHEAPSSQKRHTKLSRKTKISSTRERSSKADRSPSHRRRKDSEKRRTAEVRPDGAKGAAKEAETRGKTLPKAEIKPSQRSNSGNVKVKSGSQSRHRRPVKTSSSKDEPGPAAATELASKDHSSRGFDRNSSSKDTRHRHRKEASRGHEKRKSHSPNKYRSRRESVTSDQRLDQTRDQQTTVDRRYKGKSHTSESMIKDQKRASRLVKRQSQQDQEDALKVVSTIKMGAFSTEDSGPFQATSPTSPGGRSKHAVSKTESLCETPPRHRPATHEEPRRSEAVFSPMSDVENTNKHKDGSLIPQGNQWQKHTHSEGLPVENKKSCTTDIPSVSDRLAVITNENSQPSGRSSGDDANIIDMKFDQNSSESHKSRQGSTGRPLPAKTSSTAGQSGSGQVDQAFTSKASSVEKQRNIESNLSLPSSEGRICLAIADISLESHGKENRVPISGNREKTPQFVSDQQSLGLFDKNRISPRGSNGRPNCLEKSQEDNNAKAFGGFTAELKNEQSLVARSVSLRPSVARSKSGCEIVAAASAMRCQLHRSQSLILRRQFSDRKLDVSTHQHNKETNNLSQSREKSMKPISETQPEVSKRTQRSVKTRKSTSQKRRESSTGSASCRDIAYPRKPNSRKSPSCRPRKLENRIRRSRRIRVSDDASVTTRLNEDTDKFSIAW